MDFKDLLSPMSGLGNNIANMLWSDSQNEKAFERQQKLMQMQIKAQESMYEKYLSPQAVAQQLKEIGVNPAAHFGKGGVSPGSMPSISSPTVSGTYGEALPLENVGSNFINSISALAQAKKNTSESTAIDEKLDHEIDLLIAQKNSTEANTAYQNFLTRLHHEKLPRKLESEIERNFRLASFYSISGETEKAKRTYYNALEHLTDNQSKLSAEFASHASEYVTKIMNNLDSQSSRNYSEANKFVQESETEKQLRPLRVALTDNQAKELAKKLPGLDLDNLKKVNEVIDNIVGNDSGLGSMIKFILNGMDIQNQSEKKKKLLEVLGYGNEKD